MTRRDMIDALNYSLERKWWEEGYIDTDITTQVGACGNTNIFVAKEIEEGMKNMDERNLMNRMKKGMHVRVTVDSSYRGLTGTVEAFDYNHTRVGVRFPNRPALAWFIPSNLAVSYSLATSTGGRTTYPKPKKVVYDETAGVTVVLWMDGTKTVIRAAEGEEHDPYHGYCVALAKKIHGTNSALKRELEKVLVIQNEKEDPDDPYPNLT